MSNIKSNNSTTANTIIAGKAAIITVAKAAPTNNPITKENAVNKITKIIHKHIIFLEHFSNLLS